MKNEIPWNRLIAHFKKEADAEAEKQLAAWRAADDNEQLYQELNTLWEAICAESADYQPDTAYYWKRMEAHIKQRTPKRRSLRWMRYAATVAAAWAVMALSYLLIQQFDALHHARIQTYTSMSGKSQLMLPDGSTVWLNRGSTLRYETSFLQQRQVTLNGEALFDVRHDAAHPFVVNASPMRVTVHGTRFNVKAYPADSVLHVALLDGRVTVAAADREVTMTPGEVLSYHKGSRALTNSTSDVAFESFWARSSCSFQAQPLREIAKYLAQWYRYDIRVDDAIADTQVYTFTITDEPLETVLQIMASINPIHYAFGKNRTVTISPMSNP
jgi:ferric-dicitrate binding protein FerR (iron transport regulator)